MPKQRERNSDEWYKSEIRNLRKKIRQLEKQLKYYQRQAHGESQDEEISTDTEDTFVELKNFKLRCDDSGCGKGLMDEYEIMGRVYGTCNVCGNRKRLK